MVLIHDNKLPYVASRIPHPQNRATSMLTQMFESTYAVDTTANTPCDGSTAELVIVVRLVTATVSFACCRSRPPGIRLALLSRACVRACVRACFRAFVLACMQIGGGGAVYIDNGMYQLSIVQGAFFEIRIIVIDTENHPGVLIDRIRRYPLQY